MHHLITLARTHFDDAKAIDASRVTLSEAVRKLCEQNKCGQYGKNWTCPPAIKSVAEFRQDFAAYDTLVILYRVYHVKSSFDWRGMMAAGKDFKDRLYAFKRDIEAASPERRFLLLGAGGCHLCERCAYLDDEPCRFPQDAMISLEASGIDVMALMKDNALPYYNGKNTVTFIGGLLLSTKEMD